MSHTITKLLLYLKAYQSFYLSKLVLIRISVSLTSLLSIDYNISIYLPLNKLQSHAIRPNFDIFSCISLSQITITTTTFQIRMSERP